VKRVVCIGGGTGLAQVLKGLSGSRLELTGVVGVTDNGGHTGVIRRALDMPAVGDLRSCLAALADRRGLWPHLLGHRFHRGELDGVSTGNMMLAALYEREKSLSGAVRALTRELALPMDILPVSDAASQVCARLSGGRVVKGEWEIILRKPRAPVARLFHGPPLPALPEVRRRLASADAVVLAPGCLLTGTISTLLADGVTEAIRRSKARLIQIVNLMTQPGQTDGFGARAHAEELERLSGLRPDALIVNTALPEKKLLARYSEAGAELVADDLGFDSSWEAVRGDYLERLTEESLAGYRRGGEGRWHGRPHFIRHDARALAKALLKALG
jgi:uncharacterized cofD-like protein